MGRRLTWNLHKALFGVGALALVAGALWFWLRPAAVTTAQVTAREIRPAIQGVGTVEAKVVVQLAAKIPGRIVVMSVDHGDVVRAGQTLVQLENSESRAEVERAQANLDRAKLAVRAQEAAVLRAEAALAAAEAVTARMRTNRSLAHANAERWRKLAAADMVARMDLDERVNAADSADAELKSAEALLQAAAKEIAVQEVALKLAPKDIAAATAALASARARNRDSIITSPIDGYVVSRELETGSAVNPGTPILKLADPRTIWVTVYVDEHEAGPLAVGQAADVTLRSIPDRSFRGAVARIRRESDRVTEQLTVDIAFSERPERLILGEQAEATIRPAARKATALPLAAVVQSPNGAGAWTVVDGRMRFRRARLGAVDPAGWIEVVEGFSVGDDVVVAPGRLAELKNEGRRVAATARATGALAAEK
ncbi:MAG TPA: efflux RND transporter periplasmic adaptor subunit [Candidatus Binatia bacterium]